MAFLAGSKKRTAATADADRAARAEELRLDRAEREEERRARAEEFKLMLEASQRMLQLLVQNKTS